MKFLTSFLLVSILYFNIYAQKNENEDLYKNYNGFQACKSDVKRQSLALTHARILAEKYPGELGGLIHTFFIQDFLKLGKTNPTNTPQFLLLKALAADSNKVLVNTVTPLYYWVTIQMLESDSIASELISNFVTKVLIDHSFTYKTQRYALLIYKDISEKKQFNKESAELLNKTVTVLEACIRNAKVIEYERVWCKFLLAYSYLILGEKAEHEDNLTIASKYFKLASDFSPTTEDKQYLPAYNYDMYYLTGKDKSNGFREEYLNFISRSNQKGEDSLIILTEMSKNDPSLLNKLKSYYDKNGLKDKSFSVYWEEELNRNLKKANHFEISLINNRKFSLQEKRGKWILIDFWGTWCEPCLKDLPKLQKFFSEISRDSTLNIDLLAIACKDNRDKVRSFLNRYHYSFPVAMSDKKIEEMFNISSYPTKVLITPKGNVLHIPINYDAVEFLKLYSEFESR